MALFKIYKGTKAELDQVAKITEGYAYFTIDQGNFYVDTATERVQINAGSAVRLSDGVTTIEIDDILLTSDTIPVTNGGTGRTTLTTNAVLVGDGTNEIKLIPTTSGAFYATGFNAEPQFGTLPVGLGGTGREGSLPANTVLLGNNTGPVKLISANANGGAFYADDDTTEPHFGTLPVKQGGTGGSNVSTARTNLDVYSKTETDNEVAKVTTKAYTTTLTASGWIASDGAFYQDWNNVALSCGKNHDVPPTIVYNSGDKDAYNKLDADKTDAVPQSKIRFWASEKPSADIGIIIIDNK